MCELCIYFDGVYLGFSFFIMKNGKFGQFVYVGRFVYNEYFMEGELLVL